METKLSTLQLRALKERDRAAWLSTLRNALVAQGSRTKAARALCVPVSTLQDWVREEPTLVEGLRKSRGGRPRTLSPETIERTRRALAEHGTVSAAARALGEGWETVAARAQRYGLPCKNRLKRRVRTKGV